MILSIAEFKIVLKMLNIYHNTQKKALDLANGIIDYLILYLNFNIISKNKNYVVLQKNNLIIKLKTNIDKDICSPTWYISNQINNNKQMFNINSEMIEYILNRHDYLEGL